MVLPYAKFNNVNPDMNRVSGSGHNATSDADRAARIAAREARKAAWRAAHPKPISQTPTANRPPRPTKPSQNVRPKPVRPTPTVPTTPTPQSTNPKRLGRDANGRLSLI